MLPIPSSLEHQGCKTNRSRVSITDKTDVTARGLLGSLLALLSGIKLLHNTLPYLYRQSLTFLLMSLGLFSPFPSVESPGLGAHNPRRHSHPPSMPGRHIMPGIPPQDQDAPLLRRPFPRGLSIPASRSLASRLAAPGSAVQLWGRNPGGVRARSQPGRAEEQRRVWEPGASGALETDGSPEEAAAAGC